MQLTETKMILTLLRWYAKSGPQFAATYYTAKMCIQCLAEKKAVDETSKH